MPRLLSTAMLLEKNRLSSDHTITMCFELLIPSAAPYRLVHYDQDLVFHGLTFTRFPVDVDALEDANSMNLVRLRITAGNVDQTFQSLLENFWTQSEPWTATIWQIDAQQPDITPLSAGEIFTVMQVQTNFVTAVLDVMAEGVTLSGTMPKRRFTSTSGYPNIPRRLL